MDSNDDCTVGVLTGLDTVPERIGTFTPSYLLEWAKLLVETYGPDKTIIVDVHNCRFKDAQYLAASDDGEEPFVVCMGHEIKRRK